MSEKKAKERRRKAREALASAIIKAMKRDAVDADIMAAVEQVRGKRLR